MNGDISNQGREYKEKTVSSCFGNAAFEMPVSLRHHGSEEQAKVMSAGAHVMLPVQAWCRALGTLRPPPCTCAHSTRDQCCALELVIDLKCQRVEAVSSHLCVLPQFLRKWARSLC